MWSSAVNKIVMYLLTQNKTLQYVCCSVIPKFSVIR